MAKGSQLSQLKAAISQSGVVKPPQNGKKRKRAQNEEKDKERRAAKLQEIQQKFNPFDVKVTKLKHDVGGRKLKGVVGKPAQSKQAGIDQRKKTLLKEFEEKDRAGGIVDRRFGENDPTMTPEERMLERFTKERQRSSKGVAFNLDDEDELTHYGQSLSKLDDFDNTGLTLDDEEDEGQIDSQTVNRAHFGGFDEEDEEEDGPERKKSKAEVMSEVIAKSKEHKVQRQMDNEKNENIRHELDQELDSIRSLLMVPDPLSAALERPIPLKEAASDAKKNHDLEYDQYVRELVFDKRAKPKDRTKTEEELAVQEKEALEKAERKRLRRMRGDDEEVSDEEGRGNRKRARGGDDLEDDFMDEDGDLGGLGAGLGASVGADDDEAEDDEEGEEDEDEDEESGSEEDEDGSGSESDDFDEAAGSEGEQADLISAKPSKAKKAASTSKRKELPFTFPCPSSHEEFLNIIEDIEDSDVPTVVQRIRALYHPSLGVDNKFKLQGFAGVLIDHILYLASPPTPRFSSISSITPHLFALTKTYPIQSAEHFNAKLSLMQKNLRHGLSQGADSTTAKTWPGLPELALLRIAGALWPTSDMNHAVVTPTRLLMGSYLGLCRVRSIQDIASGLFLCTLFLQFEELSKRFVPEAVTFAINTVLHLAPHSYQDAASLPGSFPTPDFKSERSVALSLDTKKAKQLTVGSPDLPRILVGAASDEQSKLNLLSLALDLLCRFAEMYKDLDAFVELYDPILQVLEKIKAKKLCDDLQTQLSQTTDMLRRLLKFSQARQPLLLQAHKRIPIPSFIPKFESSSSSYLRARDPDFEKNEASKLRKQYKEERKGVIRELRKDSRFLAGVEQKKQQEKDQAYNMRMKRVYGGIEGERAEEKALEREKARDKRRAGRK